jgi:hypothetical protein
MSITTRLLRAHAKECLTKAIAANNPAQKAALLLMADAQHQLASRNENVVETAVTESAVSESMKTPLSPPE